MDAAFYTKDYHITSSLFSPVSVQLDTPELPHRPHRGRPGLLQQERHLPEILGAGESGDLILLPRHCVHLDHTGLSESGQ